MARAAAVLGELAQPQGHCRAPQRATDLTGGSIPWRWVRVPRAGDRSSRMLAGRWSLRASQYSSKYIRGSLQINQINVNVDVGVNTCM
eukprot:scaffold101264_cov29-Phaeocystis_antarctica.AAC.1